MGKGLLWTIKFQCQSPDDCYTYEGENHFFQKCHVCKCKEGYCELRYDNEKEKTYTVCKCPEGFYGVKCECQDKGGGGDNNEIIYPDECSEYSSGYITIRNALLSLVTDKIKYNVNEIEDCQRLCSNIQQCSFCVYHTARKACGIFYYKRDYLKHIQKDEEYYLSIRACKRETVPILSTSFTSQDHVNDLYKID